MDVPIELLQHPEKPEPPHVPLDRTLLGGQQQPRVQADSALQWKRIAYHGPIFSLRLDIEPSLNEYLGELSQLWRIAGQDGTVQCKWGSNLVLQALSSWAVYYQPKQRFVPKLPLRQAMQEIRSYFIPKLMSNFHLAPF